MDFFDHQDAARRWTKRLILYLVLGVIATAVAACVVVYPVAWFLGFFIGGLSNPTETNPFLSNPFLTVSGVLKLFLAVGAVTTAIILLASLRKTRQLASGGEAVARMLNARRIDQQTGDLAERRLLNVVEEMALASGTPVPPVHVMDNQPGINALAAGHEPGDAVIAVTRGCLVYLGRDELQGVVAHEFSHILNGDMRLNLRLIGTLYGLWAIGLIGGFLFKPWLVIKWKLSGKTPTHADRGPPFMPALPLAIPLFIVGMSGYVFVSWIKSAVSRQREYLADAAAVQFTRLPTGISGALKKIGGLREASRIKDIQAGEISHMFFGDVSESRQTKNTFRPFPTHPPLVERIRRIDPTFDGSFPKPVKPVRITPDSPKAVAKRKPGKRLETLAPGGTTPVDPGSVLAQVGTLGIGHLAYAAAILESMPEPLRDATHEPDGARAAIYALLLERDARMRKVQLDALEERAEGPSFQQTKRLAPLVDGLPDEARLPLVETAFPALRQLSPEQYRKFRGNVEALIKADSKIDLLEYAVHRMLLRHLDRHFRHRKPISVRYRRIGPLLRPLVGVLSTLAYAGQKAEADVRRAFGKGMAEIGRPASLLAKSDCSLRKLDAALNALAEATPKLKRQILGACAACVAADGKVTPREGQLLQTVAAIIGVPVPPIGAGLR